MEPTINEQHATTINADQYAINLLFHAKKSEEEVNDSLVKEGLEKENAVAIVENVQQQIKKAKKEKAKTSDYVNRSNAYWRISLLLFRIFAGRES